MKYLLMLTLQPLPVVIAGDSSMRLWLDVRSFVMVIYLLVGKMSLDQMAVDTKARRARFSKTVSKYSNQLNQT
jgi:hypothetical protein